MTDDDPLEAGDQARAEAIEALSRKRYDASVPKSAPAWGDAHPMLRYQVMEHVNDMVNEVLQHFTPMSPDHGTLALRMELLAQEIEAWDVEQRGELTSEMVATAIRNTVLEGSEYGIPKGGSNDG